MITDVYLFPNGNVESFAESQTYRIKKTKKGKRVTQIKTRPAFPVRMLSGDYSAVKFKLLPAINSCHPRIHGDNNMIEKDMRRFCTLRKKTSKEQEQDYSTVEAITAGSA